MNERIKVMIAYDGSRHADAAIDDLQRAGLPRGTEALVVSVLNQSAIRPAISEFDMFSLATRRAEAVLSRAETGRQQAVRETKDLAAKAARRLRRQFPEWRVESEVLQGNPADELLRKAAAWKPDLIVVGSQGRSAIGRFFLGSVSKKIAEEAECSVRVVRSRFEKKHDEPVKIIAGASNLKDAERVMKTIGGRTWSGETKVRLVAVDDGVSPGRVSAVYPYAAGIFEESVESLAVFGMQVSVDVKSGDAKTVLLETAENWEADSIFLAAGDESVLDETAKWLITNAECTVEIVR